MTVNIKDTEAPERIWLQPGQALDPGECTLSHVGTESVTVKDVEYIRADLARDDPPPAPDEADKALAQQTVDKFRSGTMHYAPWELLVEMFAAALAQARKETWEAAAGLARAMATGETFETGRQKALNITAALESAAKQER